MAAPRWVLTALYAFALFFLNAYLARDLFGAEFIRQPGSIESSFIALAGYAMRNWGDLTWYPLWFGGMPFHNAYQPGMHLTVAAIGTLFHLTPQHAYHFLTALIYAAAPVTLFWFCYRVARSRGYALAAGLFYSLISSSALLSKTVWGEIGGPFHPRRFHTMVVYGESPHIMATAILPIAMLCLHRAAIDRRPIYAPLASAALACLVLTNWPGTIGLVMAVAAFCISEIGEKRVAWFRLAAVALVAYLLACRWIPPSTILLAPQNAQQSDYSYFHVIHILYLAGLAAVMLPMHLGLRRAGADPFLRFGIYFTFLAGLLTLTRFWYKLNFFPQAQRFQIEMEMGIAITGCYLCKLAYDRMPPAMRITVITALFILTIPLVVSNRRFARSLTGAMDMTQTSEYKMARAFARLRPEDRVFAPGNVSLWMNVWNETPQVSGCCDQGIPDYEHRISDYTIYSGQNAGSRDAAVSLIWLRAWCATAVGVDGPGSTDPYRLRNPFKFEGVLPVLWRDGDSIVYDIPQRSRSLAHVIPRSAIITSAPAHGLQTEQLERFDAALESAQFPEALFKWKSRHSAQVSTFMQAGQVLALGISYDPGWHAHVANADRPILRDKIGQMIVDTGCAGSCEVSLVYDGGAEARAMAVLQIVGLMAALVVPLILSRLPGGSHKQR